MEIDHDKIDEAVLALMWLTLHDGCRAWKSFDWSATDRLYQKGFICDPPTTPNRWCSLMRVCKRLRARPEKGLSGQGSRDSKRVLKPNLEARDVDPDHSAAV
jgi:hypothetical protein